VILFDSSLILKKGGQTNRQQGSPAGFPDWRARAGGRAKARHSGPGPGADLLPKCRPGGALEHPPGQFGPALQVLARNGVNRRLEFQNGA
jgi:hypothetical protein